MKDVPETQASPDGIKAHANGFPYASQLPNNMHMEDVSKIALEAMAVIEAGLARFGIKIPEDREDEVFVPISNFLEGFSNGNYRNEN